MDKFPKRIGTFNLPLFDIQARYKDIMEDIEGLLGDLLFLAEFVGGRFLDQFEKAFAAYHGYENDGSFVVGVGSGMDALILALKALEIGPGDDVIVPSHTFIASALAVTHVGANVKFVDVDPLTYNIDIDEVESAIGINTRAIIAVHLYGQPCNMDRLVELTSSKGLYLIEDCAQATGAKWDGKPVGTFGTCGCFSFYPTKPLGGIGQGGAVLSKDEDLISKIRMLGDVGRSTKYEMTEIGYNSRLDTINAHFLKRCLPRLDKWNARRRAISELYRIYLEDLNEIHLPYVDPKAEHVYHLFMIGVDKYIREELMVYLSKNFISSGLYYPIPCHKQPVYNYPMYLRVTEELADSLLALPMDTYMTEQHVEYISSHLIKFFRHRG